MDFRLIGAILIAALMIVATTLFHFEALRFLAGVVGRSARASYATVISLLGGVIAIHVAEIALYAFIYGAGSGFLQLGSLVGERAVTSLDFFYFAAETYSTLGYGDILPTGQLRVIASIEPLNGLMLLAWSGSFLFVLIQDVTSKARERRSKGRR